ncbi:MAG: tetratricopeptide repeat protein [Candidatus Omnitrophica bacterium]|nr:tetratricopeptide repeat protein [Candidatus Omnitrophota bacterium]
MINVLPLSENEFSLFQRFLSEESGLYFDKDRNLSLCLALWERLQRRGYESYQEYYNLLKFHPEGKLEIRELLDLVTIGETYFFRNSPQLEVLMQHVLPEIIEKKTNSGDKSIWVWSAGCSRGAEPYSIAIAIIEALPNYEDWNISILGTDINRNALLEAREAIYSKRDVSHLSQYYIDKYFNARGTKYILDDIVKKLVRFNDHNLSRGQFSQDGMQNLDIIFCRNVTIYFDLQTTKRVIANFYNCLRQGGYLFLGHAETLWQINDKFETVEFPQTFIYKKVLYSVEEEAIKPFMGVPEINFADFAPIKNEKIEPLEVTAEPPAVKVEIEPLYKEATKLLNEKRYEQALSLFDKVIAEDKNHIRAYFAKATILANQAKYKEAIDTLGKIIEVDNLYIEAYYLLGVLMNKIGDFKEAERQFRKVIYSGPEIALTYFNLGNMYLYQKKFSKASREFNTTIRLLEKRSRDEEIRFCEDITVDFLLRACRNHLEEIGKKTRM